MLDVLIAVANSGYEHCTHYFATEFYVPIRHVVMLPFDNGPAFNPSTDGFPSEVKKKLDQLLGWTSLIVTALCVAGLFMVGGKMAINHRRGEGGEHAAGLAWVAGACLIIGTATQIVSALV
jgi:hypothetical protein